MVVGRSSQTQGSNQGFLHCRQILYQLSYEGRLSKICMEQILEIGLFQKNTKMLRETVRIEVGDFEPTLVLKF